MSEKIVKMMNDIPALRWTALILIALAMFFRYMFVDVMSPLKSLVETNLGWNSGVFGKYAASEYILKSGISIDRNETIIQGEVHDGIIAVMALKEDFVNMIMDKYCGNVSFTSPLMPQKEERK